MLSGLIRPVRIALSAALKLFPTAPDTTFTVQFYRQSRGNSLFLQRQTLPLLFNFADKAGKIHCFLQHQTLPLLFNFADKAGKNHCSLQHQTRPLQLNFTDKAGKNHCFLQRQPYLLQQTFTKDGVLNILLVVENEACYDGAKQCC